MKENSSASPFRVMHDRNRRHVLEEVLRGDRVTRQEIKQRTGLTHATVSRITREFIGADVLREGDKVNEPGKGRRRVEVNVNATAGYVVGVCLSAFQRSVSVVNVEGRREWQRDIPAAAMETPQRAVEFIGEAVDGFLGDCETARGRLLGAGVVVAGSVTDPGGTIVHAPLLRWENVPIRERLGERLGLDAAVQNVADALCLSCLDRLYAGRGHRLHIFLVHVAVGMGASLMIDGEIVRRRGDEGWIARVPATSTAAVESERLGDVVSGKAILAGIRDSAGVDASPGENMKVTERLNRAVLIANDLDGVEREAFGNAGERLGSVLGIVTAPVLPDVLVLAGPVAQARAFRERAEASYRHVRQMLDCSPVDVVMNPASYLDAAENLGLRHFLLPGLLSIARGAPGLATPSPGNHE